MFKRGRVWWTHIKLNGKNIQKSLETSNKKLASAIETKIKSEIIEGSYFDRAIWDKKTFKQMMERFTIEHAPTVSKNQQKSYQYYLKHLDDFFGNSRLTTISPKTIKQYNKFK